MTQTGLTEQEMKRIIARRDRRYDGRFYFGVRTTRIYCRPVCPARPKPENIVLFRSPAEAENSGFRPCLRCRPDLAPGSRHYDGTMKTVSRALRIIQQTPSGELTAGVLADKLGVTERHLRRLFDEHLGASPIDIMITRKLHFAKQALRETSLPVAEIAFASGFRSIRRFNEAFKARFMSSPREFRKAGAAAKGDPVTLKTPIRLPYDWDTVLAYLARHQTHGVELVERGTYRRFVPHGESFGTVAVSHQGKDFLTVQFTGIALGELRTILEKIRFLFDADHNPADIPRATKMDPKGIRVPASFDPFETAISIVLSQLVSTENATARLRKLVERYGERIGEFEGHPVYRFPPPSVLETAAVEEIGLTRVMAGAIRSLSKAVDDKTVDFSAHADFGVTTEKLLAINGIGAWTASMIAMRCLGNPDAFPDRDLVVKRVLEEQGLDQKEWLSSRAYLTHCIWRDYGKQNPSRSKPSRSKATRSKATRSKATRSKAKGLMK